MPKERSGTRGIVELRGYDRRGRLVLAHRFKNLITNVGKDNQARQMGTGGTAQIITQIGFGTDNTMPNVADTALTSAFVKDVDATNYPDGISVEFDFSLSFAEANGKNIVEMGLICANGDLFSRTIRGLIAKDASIRLEGTWRIEF